MGVAGPRPDSIIGLALFCAALSGGCAHAARAQANPGTFHLVKPGETLYRIAHAYQVPVDQIVRENGIADAAHLAAGTRLFIPKRARPQAAGRQPPAANAQLAWPVNGVLFSPFGARARDQHDGIDLAAPQGTPVRAAAAGKVLFVGKQRGYGNLILLGHPGEVVTVYAHNSENLVRIGDRVERGAVIARVGRSGTATGPHLHFEVRVAARPRDPMLFLR